MELIRNELIFGGDVDYAVLTNILVSRSKNMVLGINRGGKNCIKHALPSGRLFPTFNTKNGESTSSPGFRLTYTAHSSGGRGRDIYHRRLATMIYARSTHVLTSTSSD